MTALVLGLVLAGSDAGTPALQPQRSAPVMTSKDLARQVGRTVTVVGVAENAKGGAVVVVDGAPVYLRSLDSWPEGVRTRRVEVTGTLRDEKLIPSPTVDSKGAVSQGAEGTQLVLDKATWRAL